MHVMLGLLNTNLISSFGYRGGHDSYKMADRTLQWH
jgi:hypothetical protein